MVDAVITNKTHVFLTQNTVSIEDDLEKNIQEKTTLIIDEKSANVSSDKDNIKDINDNVMLDPPILESGWSPVRKHLVHSKPRNVLNASSLENPLKEKNAQDAAKLLANLKIDKSKWRPSRPSSETQRD